LGIVEDGDSSTGKGSAAAEGPRIRAALEEILGIAALVRNSLLLGSETHRWSFLSEKSQ
jgi:hypothetical protein